jgi:hypothetical protein
MRPAVGTRLGTDTCAACRQCDFFGTVKIVGSTKWYIHFYRIINVLHLPFVLLRHARSCTVLHRYALYTILHRPAQLCTVLSCLAPLRTFLNCYELCKCTILHCPHSYAQTCTILHYLAPLRTDLHPNSLSCTVRHHYVHYPAPSWAIQHCPAPLSTVLHYLAAQSCTVMHHPALSFQHGYAIACTIMHCQCHAQSSKCCTVSHCPALHYARSCTLLHCPAPFHTVMHCSAHTTIHLRHALQ